MCLNTLLYQILKNLCIIHDRIHSSFFRISEKKRAGFVPHQVEPRPRPAASQLVPRAHPGHDQVRDVRPVAGGPREEHGDGESNGNNTAVRGTKLIPPTMLYYCRGGSVVGGGRRERRLTRKVGQEEQVVCFVVCVVDT